MRSLKVLLSAGIVSSVNAAWSGAPVYIFGEDSPSTSGVPSALSVAPSAASLLFAQRLGLSQYYNLGDVDDVTLQLLNRFGGAGPSLFGDDEKVERRGKLFLMVEGIDKPERM
jgi:hypothetical protein